MKLTYAQWFALLALKHFSPCRADGGLRANTLRSLVARGLATESNNEFTITRTGHIVEDMTDRAPA